MSILLPISKIFAKSLQTLKRFLLALICSSIATSIAIYLVQSDTSHSSTLIKIALSSMLAAALFVAVELSRSSISHRLYLLLIALASAMAVGYYLMLTNMVDMPNESTIFFRHIFLMVLLFLAILWAPFVRHSLNNVDYWEYAKQILFLAAMTLFFTLVMIAGLNSALYATETLFGIDIEGRLYLQIDIFVIGIISVWYFLSQIPDNPQLCRYSNQIPSVEIFFTKWVLSPLSGIYFIILYAYTFKIVATMQWPEGVLAWLISAFSFVAILTYLFWTHLTVGATYRWRRWIWLAIFIQSIMLFMAIGMRVFEYSWTENRYMICIFGLWLSGISIYFLVSKKSQLKWIPLSLSLVILISQIGPLSAYTISQKAQSDRLEAMVSELKSFDDTDASPTKLRYEISDTTRYLYEHYGRASLEKLFTQIDDRFASQDQFSYFPEYVAYELGFKFINRWEYKQTKKSPIDNFAMFYAKKSNYNITDIREYDYMIGVQDYHASNSIVLQDSDIELSYQNNTLTIGAINIDMREYIDTLKKESKSKNTELSQKRLIIHKEIDNLVLKVQIHHISQRDQYIDFDADIFLKIRRVD